MTDVRRSLSHIVTEPGLPAEALKPLAEATGFALPAAPAETPAAVVADMPAPATVIRRERKKVGRDFQLSAKIKPSAAEALYALRDALDKPLAAVIEEALEDLARKHGLSR